MVEITCFPFTSGLKGFRVPGLGLSALRLRASGQSPGPSSSSRQGQLRRRPLWGEPARGPVNPPWPPVPSVSSSRRGTCRPGWRGRAPLPEGLGVLCRPSAAASLHLISGEGAPRSRPRRTRTRVAISRARGALCLAWPPAPGRQKVAQAGRGDSGLVSSGPRPPEGAAWGVSVPTPFARLPGRTQGWHLQLVRLGRDIGGQTSHLPRQKAWGAFLGLQRGPGTIPPSLADRLPGRGTWRRLMALVAVGKEPSPGRGPGGQGQGRGPTQWGEGLQAEGACWAGGSPLTPQQPGVQWGSDQPAWHPAEPRLGGCEVEHG